MEEGGRERDRTGRKKKDTHRGRLREKDREEM